MKRKYIIPVEVEAFSEAEAQASIDLLLQLGAYFKSFNLKDLLYSYAGHLLIQKVGELKSKQGAYQTSHKPM